MERGDGGKGNGDGELKLRECCEECGQGTGREERETEKENRDELQTLMSDSQHNLPRCMGTQQMGGGVQAPFLPSALWMNVSLWIHVALLTFLFFYVNDFLI